MFGQLKEPKVYLMKTVDDSWHNIPTYVDCLYPELLDETSKYKSIDELFNAINSCQENIYKILVRVFPLPISYYYPPYLGTTYGMQLGNPYDIFNLSSYTLGVFFDENDGKTIHIKWRIGGGSTHVAHLSNVREVHWNTQGILTFVASDMTTEELHSWNEIVYPGEKEFKDDLLHTYFKYNDKEEVTSLNVIFNSRDCEKLYENIIEDEHENGDGTTTYIKNLEEIYKGFKVIEREEVVKSYDGRVIKKQRRKFGIATTRSADRSFRRAGLKSMDIDDAKADLALIGAKDLLAIASRSD